MSMSDLATRVSVLKEDIMVLDCGYLEDDQARDRADRLFAFGIGKKNMSLELYPVRIYIEIPKSKQETLLAAFPIVEGSIHWGSTHHFDTKIETYLPSDQLPV